MDRLRTIAFGSCLLVAGGCSRSAPAKSGEGGLVVSASDALAVEARYAEAGGALSLHSRLDGARVRSDIVDEGGRSITARAVGVTARRASGAAPDLARNQLAV